MSNLLLTAAQMRALEQAAIDSGRVTGLELMERAGVGAVDAIFAEWPEMAAAPGRAVVLCGPGNNGGDGFVVARVLAGKGWDVEVFLYGDAERLPPDARVNYERWCELGKVLPLGDAPDAIERFPDLTIDAVFGSGLSRPLEASLFRTLSCFSQQFVVSLDAPSGCDLDSGRVLGEDGQAFHPALVIAFGHRKVGHACGDLERASKVVVVDLQLSREIAGRAGFFAEREIVHAVQVRALSPIFSKRNDGHKYDHGHALILTGGMGRTGAARLAARAALRIGAGLVTCAAPGAAMMECAAQLTAVMLRRYDNAEALAAMLEDDRINALCLGPGMGVSARVSALLDVALASGRQVVLDADALTVLAGRDDPFSLLHSKCVLTPHGGEFARLFPDIAARLKAPAMSGPAYSKVDATRDAAARAGCTVLFKGPDTVIADPNGKAAVNSAAYDRAAPWLATAGSGDVLAGIITGLLSRGVPPYHAASSAAWLHLEAAFAFGPGLIAEDLPEALPAVLRRLASDQAAFEAVTTSRPST
ncbi:NAD(P)H-hydrate dehydratase [Jannaschia pohangensis]|uniref:Bifunctional NAD(P)H-hydrate repair enzyme n=1 Tax=Jannaschia pohangensis TaxID=390807 RepID=A0A1I3II04_9RHOB|nr:NAD(P)H-hydrate dehydratase [Jannaschia pohangensis]SFI47467.1 yjeF C-terminal region, hydroxyethylthiazole kinase-related/yjeF N-terminal region [Jannaschia pohangensis]